MTERPHILPPPPGGGALRRPDEPGAAFFDLDRTLMAGSSAFQFGRAAYKAGLMTKRQLLRDGWENLVFRLHGSTDESTEALKKRIGETLKGVRVRDLQRLAPDVLAGVLPRVYPQMLEIAYGHQDAGRPIFICTAASQEMAELMAIVLTFDGAVGSVSEVVDGRYTGRAGGPFTYREGKAQAIRDLAEREQIDLAASWAYSDSESDLPMLRLVGRPVAVNPDAELGRVARLEGWEVLRFERLGRRLRVAGAAGVAAALGGLGSVSEVVVGYYTGAAGGPFTYREGKAQAIRELAEREDIELGVSWAYSDSESDLPMLRLVGHPVAVNPDAELARVAREEGWEVLRFERLGRRLRVAGAAAAAAALGGLGSVAIQRARA